MLASLDCVPTPRFKGAVWLDELEHMRSAYGDVAVDAALASLPQAQREELAQILPISWVDVTPVMACKNAVAREVGMSSDDLQRTVVRAGVKRTVRGFWRLLVRKLWDDALAKRLPILYSRTFEFGELRVEHLREGEASLRLVGWTDIHSYDALGLATGLQTILEVAGRRNVKVSWEPANKGAETLFHVRWVLAKGET